MKMSNIDSILERRINYKYVTISFFYSETEFKIECGDNGFHSASEAYAFYQLMCDRADWVRVFAKGIDMQTGEVLFSEIPIDVLRRLAKVGGITRAK